MRLSCPNCDAHYEVDDNVIPVDGRDVQCSSCGKTWFQKSAQELETEGREPIAPPTMAIQPDPVPESDPVPETDPAPEPEPEVETAPEPQSTPQEALDILREEAAIEAAARQMETIETQPDLGLDQTGDVAAARNDGANERTAKMRGIQPPIDKNSAPADMLPDIEEINSSLRASSEDEAAPDADGIETQTSRRSGFRLGFTLVILLALIALLIYIYAPQIVEKLPATKSFMDSYVDKVNGLRLWLDQLMKSVTAKITGDAS